MILNFSSNYSIYQVLGLLMLSSDIKYSMYNLICDVNYVREPQSCNISNMVSAPSSPL